MSKTSLIIFLIVLFAGVLLMYKSNYYQVDKTEDSDCIHKCDGIELKISCTSEQNCKYLCFGLHSAEGSTCSE